MELEISQFIECFIYPKSLLHNVFGPYIQQMVLTPQFFKISTIKRLRKLKTDCAHWVYLGKQTVGTSDKQMTNNQSIAKLALQNTENAIPLLGTVARKMH